MKRFLLVILLTVMAGPIVAEASLGQRIDLAGRQRMLTQRMARTACFIAIDVAVEENRKVFSASAELFATSLQVLRKGGGKLKHAPEKDPIALAELDDLDRHWASVEPLVAKYRAGEVTSNNDLLSLSRTMRTLLEGSQGLVQVLEKRADTNSAGTGQVKSNVARMTNVSGRQRMLLQKAAKEACQAELARRSNGTVNPFALASTTQQFEATAFGLAFGSVALDLPPPPTEEIEGDAAMNWLRWVVLSSTLEAIEAGGISVEELGLFSDEVELYLIDLNRTVGLYAALDPEKY